MDQWQLSVAGRVAVTGDMAGGSVAGGMTGGLEAVGSAAVTSVVAVVGAAAVTWSGPVGSVAGGISSSDGSGGSGWNSSRNREAGPLDQWQLGSAAVTAVAQWLDQQQLQGGGPVGSWQLGSAAVTAVAAVVGSAAVTGRRTGWNSGSWDQQQ